MNAPVIPSAIEQLPVDELVPYARNSRTHSPDQVAQIAASIREFGFTNPVLVDEAGTIIAGHGRVMASRELGLSTVPCIRLSHLSPSQRRAYVIADNKLALNAGWDEAMLAAELQALQDDGFSVLLTGFGDDEIGQLLAQVPVADGGNAADPDAVPVPSGGAVSRVGDVWTLGRHRVMCGDCTKPGTLATLMRGEQAHAVWTDPPYNVAYSNAAGDIANDDLPDAQFLEFLRAVFKALHGAMRPGAAIYVAHADMGETGVSFRRAFLDAGFKLAACLVWRKDCMVLGRSDYQWIHEPILYGWKLGAGHKWYGGRKQVSVNDLGASGSPFLRREDGRWQITMGEETMIVAGDATVEFVEHSVIRELRPKRNDVHPTMKPVALIERQLRNNAKAGAIVLDAFGGSGSTLIACERLGMCARLTELSPIYCDVIVRRWQEYTGLQAQLEGNGGTFAEVAVDRGVHGD